MSFNLVTWNMEGNNGDKYAAINTWLNDSDVEIVCLQECSDFFQPYASGAGPLYTGTYKYGTSTRGGAANFVYYQFGAGNSRCSLGILYKTGTGKTDVLTYGSSSTLRPLIGIEYAHKQYVYCIHAPASNGAGGVAIGLMEQIEADQWMCAGDFNKEPDELESHSSFDSHWDVTHGGFPTKINSGGNHKIYDYMVSCKAKAGNAVNAGGQISDHVPVMFTVSF
jgi:endonuclease/exonuclease/phosphatase family metal-dependent hydrolase